MNFWNRLVGRYQNSTTVGTPEPEFWQKEICSPAMKAAVYKWYGIYYGSGLQKSANSSCRLPYTIVQKLCKAVFGEYSACLPATNDESESAKKRQAGLEHAMNKLDGIKYRVMAQAMIGGECLIKPVLRDGDFDFIVIPRPNYCVLARDENGRATAYGLAEQTLEGSFCYTLYEERRVDSDGRCHITNRLYRTALPNGKPKEMPLECLNKYKKLRPEISLPAPLHSTGLVPLKMPIENCVDGSPDGVSIYAAAAGLIECVDKLEYQFEREFANAASKIIASRDLLVEQGARMVIQDDVFVGLDDDPGNVGITIFSPAIRDESYLRRKNDLLRGIENIIGLKRGLLAEVEYTDRTATEITSSAGEYSLTITALQHAFTQTAEELLRVCGLLGECYYQWGPHDDAKPSIQYGDGILMDRAAIWGEYREMVRDGLLRPEIALAWYFNRQNNAQELAEIKKTLMPAGEPAGKGSDTTHAATTNNEQPKDNAGAAG